MNRHEYYCKISNNIAKKQKKRRQPGAPEKKI